LGKSTKFKIYR